MTTVMKIGMTGSREGISSDAKKMLKRQLKSYQKKDAQYEFHHGDCIGADKKFHKYVRKYCKKGKIIIHPPNVDIMRGYCKGDEVKTQPYLVRNKNIVDQTDMLIAFPSSRTEQQRSGTWSTIRYARKKGKKIMIIFPEW